jgi:hypothetical protein
MDAQLYSNSISLLRHVEYIPEKNPLQVHFLAPIGLVSEGTLLLDTGFVFKESCSLGELVVT